MHGLLPLELIEVKALALVSPVIELHCLRLAL